MTTPRFAQFELGSWPELAKTALGATSLIAVGEPILSGLAKTIPRAALQKVVRAWSTATIRFHRVWEHPYTNRLRYGQKVSTVVLPPIPTGDATSSMRATERKMKQLALSPATAPPRRFDPTRDGFWDGDRYEIDADFPEVASLVEDHRRR